MQACRLCSWRAAVRARSGSIVRDAASFVGPLRNRKFLIYWLAGLSTNFGWQVQLVGASWLMASLHGTPEQIALVQTAVALPVMLLSVPGGAISDVIGQRSMVLWSQALLMLVSILLAGCAYFETLDPLLLLVFTFLIGSGRALYYPGWQSVVFELVSSREMTAAIAVNASGVNIARSLGPALGGAIVATVGTFAAFVVNALSNLSVILVAARWPKTQPVHELPPEPFASAILAGIRYVALSPVLVTITFRSTIFNIAAISIIAMMPLIARDQLGGGAQTYGFLLGSFGAGAVTGALCTSAVRRRMSLEIFVVLGFLGFAVAAMVLAYSANTGLSVLVSAVAGVCWIFVQVSLNTAIQLSSPRWVLSRSIGIYQTFVFGGNAIGSLIWGIVAGESGTPAALVASGGMLVAGAASGLFFKLRELEVGGLAPNAQWRAPEPALDLVLSSGPIVTSIEYRILEEDAPRFLEAMTAKRLNRIRDGASRWTLSRDIQDPTVWIERFRIATWAETQRHHSRRTVATAKLNDFIRSLHQGPDLPKVRYELVRHPGAGAQTSPQMLPRIDQ